MGIVMDFYVGDARRIGEAIENVDAEVDLHSAAFVVAHVDFSLHLGTDELDRLVHAACLHRGASPMTLQASLTDHIAGPIDPMEQEYSADVVAPALVDLLGGLGDSDLVPIAAAWTSSFGGTPNPDVQRALTGLRDACALATARSLALVFSWSL